MIPQPSTNGTNGGRDTGGRFVKGCAPGPGNPFARRVAQLRARIVASVTDSDLDSVIATLVQAAKDGEPWAIRELLDRVIGRSKPTDDGDGDGDGKVEVTIRHVNKPKYDE